MLLDRLRRAKGRPCPYCGVPMTRQGKYRATRDHVMPRALGHDLNNGNCAIVCFRCNNEKADLTLEQWFYRLAHLSDRRALHVLRFLEQREAQGADQRLPRALQSVRYAEPETPLT